MRKRKWIWITLIAIILFAVMALVGHHNYEKAEQQERDAAITNIIPGSILQVKATAEVAGKNKVILQRYYVFKKDRHTVYQCDDLRSARKVQDNQNVMGIRKLTCRAKHVAGDGTRAEMNDVKITDDNSKQVVLDVYFNQWYKNHQDMSLNSSVALDNELEQLTNQYQIDSADISLHGHLITNRGV